MSQKRYRYAGKEKDEESGLYSMGVRMYACWLGRWCSSDPIGVGDGVNRYAYVHGNPVRGRDPTGTSSLVLFLMMPKVSPEPRPEEKADLGPTRTERQMEQLQAGAPAWEVFRPDPPPEDAGLPSMPKYDPFAPAPIETRDAFSRPGNPEGVEGPEIRQYVTNTPFAMAAEEVLVGAAVARIRPGPTLGTNTYVPDEFVDPMDIKVGGEPTAVDLPSKEALQAERTKLVQLLHKWELGLDPDIGGRFRPTEGALGFDIEATVGRRLTRSTTVGDWVDAAGRTYDAVGPVPSRYFDAGSFNAQITGHLRKQGLDSVVLDLRGLSESQVASVDTYISGLSNAEQAKLMVFR